MPDHIQEILRVKVAHFDPVTVSLVGQGVYPALSLTLPRFRNEEYDQALIEAQDSLRAAKLKPQSVPRCAYLPVSRMCCSIACISSLEDSSTTTCSPAFCVHSTGCVHNKLRQIFFCSKRNICFLPCSLYFAKPKTPREDQGMDAQTNTSKAMLIQATL